MLNFSLIKKVLSKKEFNKFIFINFLNFFHFIFDLLSIISIPIFVSILIDQNLILKKIDLFLNEYLKNNFLLLSIGLVIIIFLIKNFFYLFIINYQNNFLKRLKLKLYKNIFNKYLFSNYEKFLSYNPSEVSKNTTIVIQEFSLYLTQLTNIVRESSSIIIIIICLSIVKPIIVIPAIIFFTSFIFFYFKSLRHKITSKSFYNQQLYKTFTQLVHECFNGIKDLKVLNKEEEIFKIYSNKIQLYEENISFFVIFEKLPKFLLEIISIIFLLLISYFMFSYSTSLQDLIPILTFMVISIVRLLPAFTSLSSSYFYKRIYEPSLKILILELDKFNHNHHEVHKNFNYFDNPKNISVILNNVTFNYSSNKNLANLSNINLEIKKGDITGIVGKTGSGKTTLFNVMLGLLKPKNGTVKFNNEYKNLSDKIGYVSQNIFLLNDTIEKNIIFNFNNEKIDKVKLDKAIFISDLKKTIEQLPKNIHTEVGINGVNLSGGEKQRIAIARAIYRNPEILFLDEFTSSIDSDTEDKIIERLLQYFQNKTIILIAHRKSTIAMCKSVWFLENGSLRQIK